MQIVNVIDKQFEFAVAVIWSQASSSCPAGQLYTWQIVAPLTAICSCGRMHAVLCLLTAMLCCVLAAA